MKPYYKKQIVYIEDQPATTPTEVFSFLGVALFIYAMFSILMAYVGNKQEFSSIASVVGGTLALIFAFINLELATVGLIFIFPIVGNDIPGLPFFFTYGDGYLLILTFAWLTRLMVGKDQRIQSSFMDRSIYAYLFISIFSIVNAANTFNAFKEIIQTLEYFIFTFFVVQTVIRHRESLDTLMLELALSSMFVSSYGIWEYFKMGGGEMRVTSTFAHFNAFGAYLAFLIPLFFNLWFSEKVRWRKYLLAGALITNMGAILLTFSRGAWIGVLAGLIFSGQVRGLRQLIRYTMLGTAVIIVASLFLPTSSASRLISRAASITAFNDKSTQSRFDQYRMAEEIITNSPLLGVGPGGVPAYAISRGTPLLGEIHNLALYTATERGIPALIALAAIFFIYLKTLYRQMNETPYTYFKTLYIGLMAGLVSFLAVNMSAYHLVRGLGILLGIFLGAGVAAMKIEAELIAAGDTSEETDSSVLMRNPDIVGHFAKTRGFSR